MRIVKLNSDLAVNPESVASLKVNSAYDTITIRMADGQEHHLNRDYGKSVWETHDKIVKLIAGEN
jgi:hypothetical protein